MIKNVSSFKYDINKKKYIYKYNQIHLEIEYILLKFDKIKFIMINYIFILL